MSAPIRVGYLTDDPARTYAAEILAADTLRKLRDHLRAWKDFAPDAVAVASAMREADWPEWRRGLESERRGVFAGEAWAEQFLAILLPDRLVRASAVADQFKVPWGVAWLRLKETGMLDGGPK